MNPVDAAGRIYDRLVAQYGREAVFKDVDSIPLGVDFRSAIATTIERCSVLLAVIGPDWGDKSKEDVSRLIAGVDEHLAHRFSG